MEVKMERCDNCGATVEDYYAEVGWIKIEEGFTITVSKGRIEGKSKAGYQGKVDELDFCNVKCLNEYLKKLK